MKKQLLTLGVTLLAATNLFALPPLLNKSDYKASSISNLDFNMSWENLQIKEARSDNTILVEVYCNKRKYAPKVYTSSSTLIIDSVPSKTLLFDFRPKQCTVIVYLPSGKKFNKANVSLSSGNIQETTDLSAESLLLKASSGNIKAGALRADELEVVASSGNIKVDGFTASKARVHTSSGSISTGDVQAQEISLQASSGGIKVNSLRANKADCSASSGSLKLKDTTVQEISLTTSSGGISVDGLLTNKVTASASSGTIGLEMKGAPTKKSSISTSSGTIFVSLPRDAALILNASTTSGSFTNAFTNERIGSHVDYSNKINGGGANFYLSTTSGGITVDVGDGVSGYIGNSRSSDDDDTPVVIVDRPIF